MATNYNCILRHGKNKTEGNVLTFYNSQVGAVVIVIVEDTRVPGENIVLSQVTDKLDHITLCRVGFELTTLAFSHVIKRLL
jgi:hypothetical protein